MDKHSLRGGKHNLVARLIERNLIVGVAQKLYVRKQVPLFIQRENPALGGIHKENPSILAGADIIHTAKLYPPQIVHIDHALKLESGRAFLYIPPKIVNVAVVYITAAVRCRHPYRQHEQNEYKRNADDSFYFFIHTVSPTPLFPMWTSFQ